MTFNGRSRMADLRAIAIILGLTGSISYAAWTVVNWTASVQTRAEAKQTQIEAKEVHKSIWQGVRRVDEKANGTAHQTETIGRDVKTIKCILTAPNRKEKRNCALGD